MTAWRTVERFYAEGFGFLFDNTSLLFTSNNLCKGVMFLRTFK